MKTFLVVNMNIEDEPYRDFFALRAREYEDKVVVAFRYNADIVLELNPDLKKRRY